MSHLNSDRIIPYFNWNLILNCVPLFQVDMNEKSHLEIFSPADIVCLSPDSLNVLQSVDSDKVYVLGGLVDEHIQKVKP